LDGSIPHAPINPKAGSPGGGGHGRTRMGGVVCYQEYALLLLAIKPGRHPLCHGLMNPSPVLLRGTSVSVGLYIHVGNCTRHYLVYPFQNSFRPYYFDLTKGSL
jgi:hypothetical protein